MVKTLQENKLRQWVSHNYGLFQWSLGGLVIVLALAAWATTRTSTHIALTTYDIFPLFGLIAFSIMWTHYILGAVRRWIGLERNERALYGSVSMGLVLGAIVLHPLLLWFSLWRDGYGLPPFSYLKVYSTPSLKFAVLLGTLSLCIFFAFELRHHYMKHSWWVWIERLQLLAMAAIFYHALVLGLELTERWFEIIWYVYGVSLVLATVYTYRYDNVMKGAGREKK